MFGKGQHSVEREAVKREKERRDELESLAEEARKDVLKVSISDADLQTINKDIAAIQNMSYAPQAEAITFHVDLPAGETFSDISDNNQAYLQLVEGAATILNFISPTDRCQAREYFLASELGFVAEDGLGTTSDSMLSMLSQHMAGQLPNSVDSKLKDYFESITSNWMATQGTLFERMADRFDMDKAMGQQVAPHIVYMSVASNLRPTDTQRTFLWDSRSEFLQYVEDLIQGIDVREPFSLGDLYKRASLLTTTSGGSLFTPQVAEIMRLALVALAQKAPGAIHLNPASAEALKDVAQKLETANAELDFNAAGLTNAYGKKDPNRSSDIIINADLDLGNAWEYVFWKRTRMADQSSVVIDQGGQTLHIALAEFSQARMTGNPTEIVTKAEAVDAAFKNLEKYLVQTIGDIDNLQSQLKNPVAAEMLNLLVQFRKRVSALCYDSAAGQPSTTDILAAVKLAAREQAGELLSSGKNSQPAMYLSSFDNVLDKTTINSGFKKNAAVLDFREALMRWCDAAKNRRVDADTEKEGNWPGLADATKDLVQALQPARTAIANAPESVYKQMLDAAINKAMRDVSGRLHAFANTNDAKVKDADPDALATSVDGQLRTFSNGDLVQAWKSKLKELQGGQTNTEWLVQFTDSLTAWQLYLNKKRPSNGMPFWQAQDYSWRVITALHLARTQVKNSTDNQVKANAEEYSSYFDFMAMSIYECLQTV